MTIAIEKDDSSGIEDMAVSSGDNATTVYYDLQVCRVNNPASGVYVKVSGNSAEKVFLD